MLYDIGKFCPVGWWQYHSSHQTKEMESPCPWIFSRPY